MQVKVTVLVDSKHDLQEDESDDQDHKDENIREVEECFRCFLHTLYFVVRDSIVVS